MMLILVTLLCISLPPPNSEGYVFTAVGLLVCLPVSNITEERWTDIHEIFREGGTWYKEYSGKFLGCSIWSVEHRIFLLFRGNSCLLATLRENRFSWNFHQRMGFAWTRVCWYYYWETGERMLMKFPRNVRHDTSNYYLDGFIPC